MVKTATEAVEKDGDFPFLKKEVENGSESSLVLKPEGSQAASSPHEVTKPHQTAAPRTEAPDILQQVSKKLVWSVRNGEEKIKLQLEPPQLGSLYIEIGRQKDVLQATVWTNNQVTKELLESHQVELQRILKEDGFHLGQFDVFVNPQMKSFQERMEGHTGTGSTESCLSRTARFLIAQRVRGGPASHHVMDEGESPYRFLHLKHRRKENEYWITVRNCSDVQSRRHSDQGQGVPDAGGFPESPGDADAVSRSP